MSAPDFAAIIDAFYGRNGQHPAPAVGVYALAAKVPELCPTCDGSGTVRAGRLAFNEAGASAEFHDKPCPDCPTIGQLLAIGAAVMSGVRDDDVRLTASERALGHMDRDELWSDSGKVELLAELRAVQPMTNGKWRIHV